MLDKQVHSQESDRARAILPGKPLESTIEFFQERLGFRLDAIYPADSPVVAHMSGHGVSIELDARRDIPAAELRLLRDHSSRIEDGAPESYELWAPNGTKVLISDASPPLAIPELRSSFVITKKGESAWGVGRAGMRYRDLIPGRQGGRFIASHIQVPDGGPVPDYVHYHKIRFQMIYVYKGWVKLMYEDQGPAFVMEAGDCVLQPPQIRHRVLECSPGFEVIEFGCPAEHETLVEHEFDLPTSVLRPDRDFGGQRYVLHRLSKAQWTPWRAEGFECRDTGIAQATFGLAGARVVRPSRSDSSRVADAVSHDGECAFAFVLAGDCVLSTDSEGKHALTEGDCVVLPSKMSYGFSECSRPFELLDVTLPSELAMLSGSSDVAT